MKTFTGVICVVLLALHMFGLSLVVLCFDFGYQTVESNSAGGEKYIVKAFTSTAPNESFFQDFSDSDGLFRIDDQLYNITGKVYQQDTLFVTFQSNESAWQRFTVLSEIMQDVYDTNKTSHPLSLAIKLLTDFSKSYLLSNCLRLDSPVITIHRLKEVFFNHLQCSWNQEILLPDSPPPERV